VFICVHLWPKTLSVWSGDRRLPGPDAPEGWAKKIERREGKVWVVFFHLWTHLWTIDREQPARHLRAAMERSVQRQLAPFNCAAELKMFQLTCAAAGKLEPALVHKGVHKGVIDP
jgi:hypothetical protein